MDIKVEIQPQEVSASVLTPVEPIYGGTNDYEKLNNLPSINGSVLLGDMQLEQLGIQPEGDYATKEDLPVNVSELNNDSGYLVESDLIDYAKTEDIPTKVSELDNDSDYATRSEIPTKVSELDNDLSYAKATELPTKTSELLNDSNFAYTSDIPSNVSQLTNDKNYLVRSDIADLDNHLLNTDNPHSVTKEQVGLKNVDNTSDESKPVSIAQQKAIDDAYANSNAYTDQKIADLINGAPETLDTLKEIADAMAESQEVVEALDKAIGTKANQSELDTHTSNDTIHIVQSERESWNSKYDKPTNGIPKTDLSASVQNSLNLADTSLQEHQDISGLATKTELNSHINNTENPHGVTKAQVGLGNCDNTSDADKPISTAQQESFDNVNERVDTLSYDDVVGGKNIFNLQDAEFFKQNSSNTVTIDGDKLTITGYWYCYTIVDVEKNTDYSISVQNITSEITGTIAITITNLTDIIHAQGTNYSFNTGDNEKISILFYSGNSSSGTTTFEKIQLEKGNQITPYKPFIPSVKMLAEKTTQIDDNNMLGYVVPTECPIQNYVDSNYVFHQRVGRVDLGSLNFTYSSNGWFQFLISDAKSSGYAYISKYIFVQNSSNISDKQFSILYNKYIIIKDSSYAEDATAFKNAMQGVYLYYELATETTINVDGNEAVTILSTDLAALIAELKEKGVID